MEKHIMFSLTATVLWGFWAILVKISSTRIGHWPSILVYTIFGDMGEYLFQILFYLLFLGLFSCLQVYEFLFVYL